MHWFTSKYGEKLGLSTKEGAGPMIDRGAYNKVKLQVENGIYDPYEELRKAQRERKRSLTFRI